MALKGTTYPNNKSDIGHTRLKQKEKKKYTNNFCQSLPEGVKEGKREKKKTIAKLFALQANAIRSQKKKQFLAQFLLSWNLVKSFLYNI